MSDNQESVAIAFASGIAVYVAGVGLGTIYGMIVSLVRGWIKR
jgi:ABC-type dipeptide/oligopeptide/nickel transport system permease subunit